MEVVSFVAVQSGLSYGCNPYVDIYYTRVRCKSFFHQVFKLSHFVVTSIMEQKVTVKVRSVLWCGS
jgi:hypothetical protein